MRDYSNIPTSALVELARLITKRTQLSLLAENREQALCIIRSIRPAPPRKSPHNIKAKVPQCCVCHSPIPNGSLCDSLGRMHIECQP